MGDWRERLHDFHLTGRGEVHDREPHGALPLVPEALEAIAAAEAATGEPPDGRGALAFYEEIVGGDRARRRTALRAEIDPLLEQLRRLTGAAGTSDALQAALGPAGASMLDAEALRRAVRGRPVATELSAGRRSRIVDACERLERFSRWLDSGPHFVAVSNDDDDDPLGAATGLFDGDAARLVDGVGAMRTARLESKGEYDPAFHDPVFARLDWQGLTADELRAMPAIVVVERAERLGGPLLGALSGLLRSARPIHVLAHRDIAELTPATDSDGGFAVGLAQLAMAHREVFVLQGTPARPRALARGFEKMAAAVSPALAVVARAGAGAVPAELQLQAALWARVTPCFTYDPAAGPSWAERLDLSGNPDSAGTWPVLTVSDADQAWTPAHLALLDPAGRAHARIVPPEAYGDDQVDVDTWLERPATERRALLPYVSVVDGNGEPKRAAVTRVLAFACMDRAQAWGMLRELAGADRDPLERTDPVPEVDSPAPAPAPSEDGIVVIERLVRILAGESVDASQIVAGTDATPPVATPPVAAPPLSESPYIDSALCTTCNECTKLNAKLFRYNADRQAEIADPGAGTYAQLVKAAELCPARCIHPGAPKPGDRSATDSVVARAAKFRT